MNFNTPMNMNIKDFKMGNFIIWVDQEQNKDGG